MDGPQIAPAPKSPNLIRLEDAIAIVVKLDVKLAKPKMKLMTCLLQSGSAFKSIGVQNGQSESRAF